MKIALVRGPFLNAWELQTYLPLAERHALTAIGADWSFFPRPEIGISSQIVEPHLWGASSARFHKQLPVILNRLRSWTWGESYGLSGLEKAIGDADILHPAETHSTMTYQCLQIRKRHSCKVIATIWENLPHMGETHPRRKVRKREALNTLDGFLAVTETSRKMLLKEGAPPERIDVIPMAVDLAHFKPAPRDPAMMARWRLKPDEKVVLFIGRFVEEKGVREILEAVPEVLKAVSSDVRFCFVGAGPLGPLLKKAEQEHPGRVSVVPFASYDQLPALHNMADVFVLPSKPAAKWEEQFGYVLVESMACGKAIVTTRSGSIPDVVGDAAMLVPPSSTSALASSLIHLLSSDSEKLRLGQKALARALEQFDSQKNARRIETFYERVLKQPS